MNSTDFKYDTHLIATEDQNNTDLVVKVETHKYYISLPTWVVEQKGYRTDRVEELAVVQFKDIEIYLIEISKIESASKRKYCFNNVLQDSKVVLVM